MGYNKQLVYPAFFNSHHFKQKSDPELPMIRNYRKHCIISFSELMNSQDKYVLIGLSKFCKIVMSIFKP